jgi:CHAT domain-containing protein
MTLLRRGAAAILVFALTLVTVGAQPEGARLIDSAEARLKARDLAGARPLFEQALTEARAAANEAETARALLGLGRVARREGRPVDAHASLTEAYAIFERLEDQHGIASAAYELAFSTRDRDAANVLYMRAAEAARLAGDRDLEGSALHDYGDQLFVVGRYEESLDLLTQAAAAFEAVNLTDDLGTVYNSIGRVYRAHGRLDEALRYQQAALALHRTGTDPFALAQSLNAVSSVYQRMNDPAAALPYLEEAITVAAALPPDAAGARIQDFLRANMAAVLADQGELAPAAAALEQVIANGRDSLPAIRYQQLSTVYQRMGRGADALAAAERAVALCEDAVDVCIAALNSRSDAKALLGDRDGALADLSQTLRQIEDLRARLVPADFFKRDYSHSYHAAYASAIARQLDAGQQREALETAELARSRAFLDLLASRDISLGAPGPALPLTMRGAAAALASPAQVPPANAADLIATAARLRSTLLVYWVGDDETAIWVVSPDRSVVSRRVKVTRARLTSLIRSTAPFAAAQTESRPAVLRQSPAAWRELYTHLIAPVRRLLPTRNGALLTVVPDETLSSLSFAALQDARGRYLLEDYALHYATAGALFQFTAAQRRPESRSGPLLIVADPDPARPSTLDPALPRLPGARNEAAAIARQLPAGRVTVLSSTAATEAAVRQQAPARAVLHFAAHAAVSDQDPFASYLALTRSAAASDSDGVLTAREIYDMKLAADLVVLSACRSASGTVGGDGVATFARAFLYSGAASLIASVWDVADETADAFLPGFYRAWRRGASKAVALREAQLRRLAELRAGKVRVMTPVGPVVIPEHPVFWAGFVLFGEPD